jgi:ankyrin repeat protein
VQALLRAGWNVNARGSGGETALHWACWNGNADLVRLLLEHGASLKVKENADYPQVERLLRLAGGEIRPQESDI